MAKIKKDNNGQGQMIQSNQSPMSQGSGEAKGGKSGFLFGLLAFLTALLIMTAVLAGAFYFVINKNINGVASKYRSEIQGVFFLKWMLPEPPDPEDDKYMTEEDVRKKYRELRKIRDQLKNELKQANEKISSLEKYKSEVNKIKAENEKIKKESEQEKVRLDTLRKQLELERKQLNEMIASGDKTGFKEYFEKVDKATAEKIYTEIMKEEKLSQEAQKFLQVVEEMDPEAAAKDLEAFGESKIPEVSAILLKLKKDVSAEILSGMSTEFAAKVMVKMAININNGQG